METVPDDIIISESKISVSNDYSVDRPPLVRCSPYGIYYYYYYFLNIFPCLFIVTICLKYLATILTQLSPIFILCERYFVSL